MPAALKADEYAAGRERLLDAVESLVYAKGVHAVGMDQIRETSSMSLKRIYSLFATKEDLIVAMLQRRDRRWRASLASYVEQSDEPMKRVLALFEWLHDWFEEPGFRGCVWINIHGEIGSTSEPVRAEVRAHKEAFRAQVTSWVRDTGSAASEAIFLLAEGAIVSAGITGDPETARRARATAELILADVATSAEPDSQQAQPS